MMDEPGDDAGRVVLAGDAPGEAGPGPRARCPGCGRPCDETLDPGAVCQACQAASPWREIDGDQPAARVEISRGDIEEAETRRLGYRPKTPLGLVAIKYVLPGLAAALGLASLVEMAMMVGPQDLTDIATVLSTFSRRAMRVTLLGGAALVLGTVLLLVLRRSRLFRAWVPVGLTLLAVPAGAAGSVVGALYWSGTSSYSFKHVTMPAIPKIMLEDSYKARIARAMVVVFAPDPGGDITRSGLGSGTVVRRKGGKVGVLTCSHVALPDQSPSAFRTADPSRVLYVTFSDGRTARASVTWTAPPPVDLAMLEAEIDGAPAPVDVSRSADSLNKGASVTFSAHPYRHGWRFHTGKILERRVHNTPAGKFSLIISDLPAEHGDSGTGLYDAAGRLVGVITWKSRVDGKPQGISLPSDALIKYFKLDKDSTSP